MEEIWFETPRGRIYGRQAGEGPMLLALHGWSQRNGWHTWKPLMAPLAAAGYYVVSVDMPGWGRSPAQTTGPLQAQDATRVVIEILDAAGAVDATLLGKSWGGGIALQTALDYPGRVRSLILTAPAFRDFSVLGQLQAPVLLVWAEDDPVIPISFAREYMERIADLRLVTYPHGGHSAAPKNADEFAPEAVAFLRQTIASEDADQRDRAQHST